MVVTFFSFRYPDINVLCLAPKPALFIVVMVGDRKQ